jgi:DNA-binding transcriptional MerR regulator
MVSSLAIGDFSRATHFSVKTLRHYHRLGLLIPAEIDPDSSYRRYTTEQIPTAQVIRRFRDLEMPLDQIGAVLQAPDVESRNELISAHLARLEQNLLETQEAVASLRDMLQGSSPATPLEHRSDPALQTAAISETVSLDVLAPWFQGALGELTATLAAQGVTTTAGRRSRQRLLLRRAGCHHPLLSIGGDDSPDRTRRTTVPAPCRAGDHCARRIP